MKKIFYSLLLLMAVSLSYPTILHAEENGVGEHDLQNIRTEILKQKKEFFIKELQLTEAEANNLMSILEELDTKRFDIWKSSAKMHRRIRQNDPTITKEEMNKHFEEIANNKIKEAELEKEYFNRCKNILPMEKLIQLESTNRKFAKQCLQKRKHYNNH